MKDTGIIKTGYYMETKVTITSKYTNYGKSHIRVITEQVVYLWVTLEDIELISNQTIDHYEIF